ncbi:MAG: hypothetical protein CYG59_01590 [Chloroflexi bacterium]|nr:MAG: hypothetical protein CYG59_01590 [Chloroflexota bacterium]
MKLPATSPAPIQLMLPLHDVVPTLPDPRPEEIIRPCHVWTTLTPLQRQQFCQHLTAVLQEIFYAADPT